MKYYNECMKNNEVPIPKITINESAILSEMKISDAFAGSYENKQIKNLFVENCNVNDSQIAKIILGCPNIRKFVYSGGGFGNNGV